MSVYFPTESNHKDRGRIGGFAFSLDLSVSYIATAIHAGNHVREELLPLMKIDAEKRYLEEDPETDTMIQNAESAIWSLDSRSEYDLNRPPEDALPLTPEKFWGIRVYKTRPNKEMIRASMAKYNKFYDFLISWIKAVLERFDACIVYDIHSYNVTRQVEKGVSYPPVFNVCTKAINRQYWAGAIDDWLDRLKKISIPEVDTTVAENLVFQGKGELCRRLTQLDPRILVLPTEIAKVYMDEAQGKVHKKVVHALRRGIGQTMVEHSNNFLHRYGKTDSI